MVRGMELVAGDGLERRYCFGTDETQLRQAGGTGMVKGMRRWGLVLSLAAIVGGMVWGGWRWSRIRRYRVRAGGDPRADPGRPPRGRARNLAALMTWEPGSDEAAYLLGVCEKARGRSEAAAAAWARVPARFAVRGSGDPGSRRAGSDRGRLADAEQVLNRSACRIPRSTASTCAGSVRRSTGMKDDSRNRGG